MTPSEMPNSDDQQSQTILVKALIQNLEQEESVLNQTLDALLESRKALVDNDLDNFSRSLENQTAIANQADESRVKRSQILQDLAISLDKDAESLTLQTVAEALPAPECEWLMSCRDRLSKLTSEAQRLNGQNAVMVHQSVELTRQILTELTRDGVGGGDSYDATGARQDATGRSIIELGG